MSTLPLPVNITGKIAARRQAVRWYAVLKEVRTFSSYCCNIDSDGIMGVAKQPVPIVSITPNPVCLGESIDWDLTDSYAPGSTISAWEIDFGDSSNDTGALIGSASGSHVYAAVGSYTITITIEEGLGKTAETTREVTVVDCSEPPLKSLYVSTYGQGVWYVNLNDTPLAWESRNTGLTGNALFVNSMAMKPGDEHKNPSNQELWIATRGGVFKSDNGGKGWQEIAMADPSNTEFFLSPPATADELEWKCVRFDPATGDVIIEATRVS